MFIRAVFFSLCLALLACSAPFVADGSAPDSAVDVDAQPAQAVQPALPAASASPLGDDAGTPDATPLVADAAHVEPDASRTPDAAAPVDSATPPADACMYAVDYDAAPAFHPCQRDRDCPVNQICGESTRCEWGCRNVLGVYNCDGQCSKTDGTTGVCLTCN